MDRNITVVDIQHWVLHLWSAPLCLHVCVSYRPTYGSSSPGLLHHFPILFQQSVSNLLPGLHLSSRLLPFPYNLTSPFPLSAHWFCPLCYQYLNPSFPLTPVWLSSIFLSLYTFTTLLSSTACLAWVHHSPPVMSPSLSCTFRSTRHPLFIFLLRLLHQYWCLNPYNFFLSCAASWDACQGLTYWQAGLLEQCFT